MLGGLELSENKPHLSLDTLNASVILSLSHVEALSCRDELVLCLTCLFLALLQAAAELLVGLAQLVFTLLVA